MRMSIEIDDRLMAEALKTSGATSKRDVVEAGLRMLVQLGKQGEIRKLRGKLHWEGDLDAMRLD